MRYPSNSKLQTYLPPISLVVVGLTISFGAFTAVQRSDVESRIDQAQRAFQRDARQRAELVEHQITSTVESVQVLGDLLEAVPGLDRRGFKDFATKMLTRHPAISALEWIPRVPAAERAAYEARARADGFESFGFTERTQEREFVPAGDRENYFPVFFVEPYTPNKSALGFDIGSEPRRRAALRLAATRGVTAAARVTLVQDEGPSWGLLLLDPVYDGTVERSLRGFALAVLKLNHIVEMAIDAQEREAIDERIVIFDDSAPAATRLIYHVGGDEDARSATANECVTRRFEVSGRPFSIKVCADKEHPYRLALAAPTFGLSRIGALPWTLLLGGFLLSLLLAGYLLMLRTREARTEAVVTQRTEALRTSESRLKAVFDTVVDGIVTTGVDGALLSMNAAAERLFGYEAGEIAGKRLEVLVAPADAAIIGELVAGRIVSDSQRLAVTGQRRDGSRFPMEVASSTVDAPSTGLTVTLRDMTAQRKVEQLKDQFLSTVNHELRTPLTAVRGALGLLEGGVLGELPEAAERLVAIADMNCQRLAALVDDLLDTQRIEAGSLELDMKPVDLRDIVIDAIVVNQPYATALGVTLSRPDALPRAIVTGDAGRLIQVMTNLIANGAKFSPRGETVSISLTRDEFTARASVSDSGIGIAPEFHDRVFERFARHDGTDVREKGGTGLGLSICKALVEAHGGVIDFDTRVGAGTTFYFELPLHRTSKDDSVAMGLS